MMLSCVVQPQLFLLSESLPDQPSLYIIMLYHHAGTMELESIWAFMKREGSGRRWTI